MGKPPWHRWYCTAQWRAIKAAAHVRDNLVCQKCGAICSGQGQADNAPIADHIVPHRGRRDLFFDLSNVQTLCKWPCHDKEKQREEQGSRKMQGRWG